MSHNTNPKPRSDHASSVNQDELSHFAALASSWWDPHGPSRLLHLMNPIRHDFTQRCRSQHTPPGQARPAKLDYLDIGCGGGIFAESAARLSDTGRVVAIDPTPEVLAIARQHARRDPSLHPSTGKLTYLDTSIEGLAAALASLPANDGATAPSPAPPGRRSDQFDVVSLFEVIEHITHPSPFLRSVLPHVRPGGWLVGSTIARTWASWFTTVFVAERALGIVPPGTHDWRQYVNAAELRRWFGKLDAERDPQLGRWATPVFMEVMYVPGLGWKEVGGNGKGIEGVGNYFFGVRREE